MDSLIFASVLSLAGVTSLLTVALGLGFVIFVHELGHFAVAKWCGVQVDRFSIGFGPVIWSRTWGETEYALSLLPLGGYVKMLGQDDADPSQETSEEVAQDPRSYRAKNVPQRMAIISAGVIMNLITGSLFYVLAMDMGLDYTTSRVGYVSPGQPAWTAGMRPDDLITSINGSPITEFRDITRGTALSSSNVRVAGLHSDGTTFDVVLVPDSSGSKRIIGVGPGEMNQLIDPMGDDGWSIAIPGTPASKIENLPPGAKVISANGKPVVDFASLRAELVASRAEPIELGLRHKPKSDTSNSSDAAGGAAPVESKITIAAQPFRTLGVRMDIGKVTAIVNDSPAMKAGIAVGDRILKVDGLDMTREIDPLALPDYFADHATQAVSVVVKRAEENTSAVELTMNVTPDANRPGWVEVPGMVNAPLTVPAIGIAFEIVPTIVAIEHGSPAEKGGLKETDVVTHVRFVPDAAFPENLLSDLGELKIDLTENKRAWTYIFWQMQRFPTWDVELTVKSSDDSEPRVVLLTPQNSTEWFVPSTRGLQFDYERGHREALTVSEAFSMGFHETKGSATDIYLTLRSLFTGRISPTELQGPIGIVGIGMSIARSGFAPFLVFLGFLSVNLAVINFLPIPVLDGGHMVFLIYEGVTGKQPNERVFIIATYVGLAFVLGLMIFVLTLDLGRVFLGPS